MKKICLIVVLWLIVLSFHKTSINAASKREVPYEINSISINSITKTLDIKGWGFITNAQNFENKNTHKYTLKLNAKDHVVTSYGRLLKISHTDTMAFAGSPYCGKNDFFKDQTICNHAYENVGFLFSIPLNSFKMDKQYEASLTVDAFQANVSKSIKIYFPVKEDLVLKDGKYNYLVDSKLNDTSLKIIFDSVFVRDKVGKSGNISKSKLNCSSRNTLFYQNGSNFYNIFDKQYSASNKTTYYQLGVKEVGCYNNEALVNEGNNIYPVWIASNFVDYSGMPLTVKTFETNLKPSIKVNVHPTIYVDDKIDFMDQVTASDKEDGDLTNKIKITKNNFQNKPGSYQVSYLVTDSGGKSASAAKNITVLKRNYPPVINASDIEIKQFSLYNPYLNVSAYDQDQTDITNKVFATPNSVNPDIVKLQTQCYNVVDKYNLSADKCIKVHVIKADSNFRFIAKDNIFYKEDIPKVWKLKMLRLQAEVSNEIVYKKRTISK